MDPKVIKTTKDSVTQDEKNGCKEELRFKLNNFYLKRRTKWSPKVISAAKLEHLEEMMRVYNSRRLKGFSKSLMGKFVFIGSKLLEKADLIADSVALKKEVMEDELFLEDVEDLFGGLTSHVPKGRSLLWSDDGWESCCPSQVAPRCCCKTIYWRARGRRRTEPSRPRRRENGRSNTNRIFGLICVNLYSFTLVGERIF